MLITDLLLDMIFAAIAGMGFGAISTPSVRCFKYIGILAAVGHVARYMLLNYVEVDIASASFAGALIVGFGGLFLGKMAKVPITVLCIPALLPMIPGKFAYNMVFSLIMFMQNLDNPALKSNYMDMFFSNGMITSTTLFLLAAGVTLPMLLFPRFALSFTRKTRKSKNKPPLK